MLQLQPTNLVTITTDTKTTDKDKQIQEIDKGNDISYGSAAV